MEIVQTARSDCETGRQSISEHNLVGGLIEAVWLLIALLTPLVVNLWADQPFEPPKAALLRSLVWIMAGIVLADWLLNRRSPWHDLRENPLLWPVLALAGVCALATALAVDPGLSAWGSYERVQGLWTLLSYLLLILLVATRLRSPSRIRRLSTIIVATALPLVALGLLQALGWQPVPLITDARSPLYATLGRSNFLGAYLAMLLPLTLAWTWTAPTHRLRIAAGALVLGELVVIGLTLARAAWLAAAVGAGVMALVIGWPRLRAGGRRWMKPAVAGALAVLAVMLIVATLVIMAQYGAEGSPAARLTIWRATIDLIARRPLLGYGPDGLGLVFPRVYPPELVYYQGRGLVVDRAHNLLLDGLATTGVLGLAAGLALLATFCAVAWRAAVRPGAGPPRRVWLAACLAAIAANVSGNLVSFDVTATATLTALVMALGVALARPNDAETAPDRSPAAPLQLWRLLAVALLVPVVGIAILQANVRPLAAGVAARTGERKAAAGDCSGAIAAREGAVALQPSEPAHRRALGYAYMQAAESGADPLHWLRLAEAELLAARDLRPDDWQGWAALGELYALWGNRWDPSQLAAAHTAYGEAVERAPQLAMLYTSWGMVDLEGGRYADAAARFRQAVDLDATDGYAFSHLGDAELARGRAAEAVEAYRQAVHWEPALSQAHLGLVRGYWQLGQRQAAMLELEQALQINPNDAAAWMLSREIEDAP